MMAEVKQYMNTDQAVLLKPNLIWNGVLDMGSMVIITIFKWKAVFNGCSYIGFSKEGQDSVYRGEVPEFVLNKALQIKKEMPQANFHFGICIPSKTISFCEFRRISTPRIIFH